MRRSLATTTLAVLLVGSARALVLPSPTLLRTLRSGRACAVRAELEPQWEPGQDAASWLRAGRTCPATEDVLLALFSACKEVSASIATASCDSFACFNDFGALEESIAVDVLAEQVMIDRLTETGRVAVASSVSDKLMQQLCPDGELSVSLDPIDASSILDTNFAVGSIFGLWDSPQLLNVTGRQLLAAGTCTYGPRTLLTVALADRPAVYELTLIDGQWLLSNSFSQMREGFLFAPGNLRATTTNPGFASLVQYWHDNRYQLRYTGGMVSDVNQLMVKGHGIFVNPASPGERPRLRILYEAAPMAFLMEKVATVTDATDSTDVAVERGRMVEAGARLHSGVEACACPHPSRQRLPPQRLLPCAQAGGVSSDGERSLLDAMVTGSDDRTQVALGSAGEVARFDAMVGPVAAREGAALG